MVGWGRKSYLGTGKIGSFSSRNFRPSSKYGTFWYVVTTGYFYVLFLWTIAVSDFCLLEICKGFLLSTITFRINSHAGNHFYKHICRNVYRIENILIEFCFKYYTVWNQFLLLKYLLSWTKVFYIQIWFKCKIPILFFLTHVFFCCRLCKNYWITYCTHMTSYVIYEDEIADVMISIKKINKS